MKWPPFAHVLVWVALALLGWLIIAAVVLGIAALLADGWTP